MKKKLEKFYKKIEQKLNITLTHFRPENFHISKKLEFLVNFRLVITGRI